MNLAQANEAIGNDTGLSDSEKQYLGKDETQKDIEKFLAGAAGATLGVVIAKYLRLGRTLQVVLGTLGYGAGRAIYTAIKNYRSGSQYDNDLGTYKIDSKRY